MMDIVTVNMSSQRLGYEMRIFGALVRKVSAPDISVAKAQAEQANRIIAEEVERRAPGCTGSVRCAIALAATIGVPVYNVQELMP